MSQSTESSKSSQDQDSTEQESGGQVSEVTSLDPGEADTPISDDQAVAGYPKSESGDADEGPTGPDANPHADEPTH